jgi:hypothetical protein
MESLLERLMSDWEGSGDFGQARIGQEELDAQKVAAGEGSLSLARGSTSGVPQTRMPAVKAPGESRRGRKIAEEEQVRQWRMVNTTTRSYAAINSVIAVTAHALIQVDVLQDVMTQRFYGVKRREPLNQFMADVTSRFLRLGEAGVLAILESHPKRIAEDL